ncbi:hypothetical protein [Nocardioides sp.]|uniref:sulfotransferase family protein n=1 Tax=Nocardioides sp. TaxID=35761 RepID=UPI003569D75E
MAPAEQDTGTSAADERSLVFVLGPGRSGTSTMAGALNYSGYKVPQAIKGNATNPSGFFEPRWAVNFHRRLLRATGVRTLDTNPAVLRRLQRVLTDPEIRDELREWLEPRLEQHQRMVIKDPRMVWFRDLWVDAAEKLGVDPKFVIMLRHPSEVSSSRTSYYNAREIPAVAGWINVALMTEKLTAGSPRAIVHYPDLTADWRTEFVRLRDSLGLKLDPAPEQTEGHPVDDFIDPRLRRMKPGWGESGVPQHLQVLGDRTFDALNELAHQGESAGSAEKLEELREEYARVHQDAMMVVRPTIARAREEAARKARRQLRRKLAHQEVAAHAGVVGKARRFAGRVRRKLLADRGSRAAS